MKLARLRKPKIASSPSYANYRPKTNAAIIGHRSHYRETGNRRERARERNQKLICGWCDHCIGMNTVILNWPRPPWDED
jgi:hypothetical protein